MVADKLMNAARWNDFVTRRKECSVTLTPAEDGF